MVYGEIFETFRKRFGNVSGYAGRGINWYINGIYKDAYNGTVTGTPEENAGFSVTNMATARWCATTTMSRRKSSTQR